MRGTLCSQGGGGGNDGAAGTCVWGSVAGCASLRGSFGKGQRERDAGHLSSVSAVVLATARTWEGKAPKKSHFPWVHSGPLGFSSSLSSRPFTPAFSPSC